VEARLALVRDLLDKKVVDRHGRELGRVDSIIVEHDGAGAPRVTAIELGASVLARRIHPLAGRCAAGLERALGIDEGRPMRVPFSQIIDIADHVRVDLAAGSTPATALEQRLRKIVSSIPGGA
jgi:sporulation protein YlmC with PRC-barrel domain